MYHKFLVSLIVMFLIAGCAPAALGLIPTTSAVAPGEIPDLFPTFTPPAARRL